MDEMDRLEKIRTKVAIGACSSAAVPDMEYLLNRLDAARYKCQDFIDAFESGADSDFYRGRANGARAILEVLNPKEGLNE